MGSFEFAIVNDTASSWVVEHATCAPGTFLAEPPALDTTRVSPDLFPTFSFSVREDVLAGSAGEVRWVRQGGGGGFRLAWSRIHGQEERYSQRVDPDAPVEVTHSIDDGRLRWWLARAG